jgi:hypothetical protein
MKSAIHGRIWRNIAAVGVTVLVYVGTALVGSIAAARVEPEERGTATMAGVRVNAVADSWTGVPCLHP